MCGAPSRTRQSSGSGAVGPVAFRMGVRLGTNLRAS
uniref:Uncharacterized protein n=1 Tax=Anguilla anguilla TaxID=7936 RepID=A0A0E9U6Y3_ANGAN